MVDELGVSVVILAVEASASTTSRSMYLYRCIYSGGWLSISKYDARTGELVGL